MVRARSRFDVGWVRDIADDLAAKEHAEEVVQDVLRAAEEKEQFAKLLKEIVVAGHEIVKGQR